MNLLKNEFHPVIVSLFLECVIHLLITGLLCVSVYVTPMCIYGCVRGLEVQDKCVHEP